MCARRSSQFLSHDWGIDSVGRSNHLRVETVDAKLRSHGMATWFDATMMKGDINAAMTDGIDRSKTVVVFVTRNYLIKAAGLGPNGLGDNCVCTTRGPRESFG